MLPKVTKISTTKKLQLQLSKPDLKQSTLSKMTKALQQVSTYQQKYNNELSINTNLKTILSNIKQNQQTTIKINEQQHQLHLLKKQKNKYQILIQNQSNNLNTLISQNNSLKNFVNIERSKRVIYFNVYKNLQRQIHQWEIKYKNLLVSTLEIQGTTNKIQDKFKKTIKKLQRDIQSLHQQLQHLQTQDAKNDQQLTQAIISKKHSLKTTPSQPQQLNGSPIKNYNQTCLPLNQNLHEQPPIKNTPDIKLIDINQQYELKQKTLYIEGIMNRLKQITGKTQLPQCITTLKTVSQQIQYNINLFNQQQTKQKQLLKQLNQLEQQLNKIQYDNQTKKITQLQIQGQKQIENINLYIRNMEQKLQQKIGIKVSQVSNQMLLHHCLRIRDDNKKKKRNLQKSLQQTKKQKSQCSLILTPKQMHRRIVQSQSRQL